MDLNVVLNTKRNGGYKDQKHESSWGMSCIIFLQYIHYLKKIKKIILKK
jgi:hypothetical protein